jgi:RNA-binding protein
MRLTESQKKFLRKLAHALKPVVIIGDAGLSENVLKEINIALNHHELIKIRVNAGDRQERDTLIKKIVAVTTAEPVMQIGHVVVVYRPGEKEKIELPK